MHPAWPRSAHFSNKNYAALLVQLHAGTDPATYCASRNLDAPLRNSTPRNQTYSSPQALPCQGWIHARAVLPADDVDQGPGLRAGEQRPRLRLWLSSFPPSRRRNLGRVLLQIGDGLLAIAIIWRILRLRLQCRAQIIQCVMFLATPARGTRRQWSSKGQQVVHLFVLYPHFFTHSAFCSLGRVRSYNSLSSGFSPVNLNLKVE